MTQISRAMVKLSEVHAGAGAKARARPVKARSPDVLQLVDLTHFLHADRSPRRSKML
jgi:hypothetical protein